MIKGRLSAGLLALAALLALGSAPAAAEIAKPTAKAAHQGFVVVASVVTDADWRQKWNTPSETTPEFHLAGKMGVGEKAWVLTFFSGAALKDGIATLECDVTIRDPEGIVQKHPPQLCYQGPVAEPEGMLHMTGLELGFEVKANDFDGLARFEIGITDVNRDLRVPVRVSVEFATGNKPR
jgi:hypothetical protein